MFLMKRSESSGSESLVPASPAIISEISKFNSNLTPTQVEAALQAGDRVYTNFSSYIDAAVLRS